MEKVDIFKTVTKARSADFLGEEWAYISSVSGDSDYFLFHDEKCHLLNNENEFYKIINKQFENGKIYIAIAFIYGDPMNDNEEHLGVETSIGDFKIDAKKKFV